MRGPLALALVIASAPMFGVEAQSASFQIRLRARGPGGPLPCADPGGISDDIFTGKVTGNESELASSQEIVYRGVLERKSNLLMCDASRSPGSDEDRLCSMQLSGGGKMNVELTVPADGVHTYVKLEPIRKTMHVDQSSGDCDQELAAGFVENYLTGGEGTDILCAPAAPLREKTKCAQPSSGHGDPPGPWTLEVLAAKQLRADPGGPYAVERGKEVVLDGSRSEGDITDYTWTLAAHDCPVSTMPVSQHGVRQPLRPLCPVTATLTVTDGTDEKSASVEVGVVARSFKTDFPSSTPTDWLSGVNLVKPCGCNFGRNVCKIEFDQGAMESFHYIHHDGVSRDYEHTAYELGQHADPSGLFNQWWWVSKNLVQVKRVELLNVELAPGGILDRENSKAHPASPGKASDFDRIVACTRAHEKAHTELFREALNADDPAKKIESMIQLPAADPTTLRGKVNDELARAEGRLGDADDENAVAARLRNVSACKDTATIRLRSASSPPASPIYLDENLGILADKSDKGGGSPP